MSCDGVPLAEIPTELTEARVFQLRLANNGMHKFPDAKLSGSGERKRKRSSGKTFKGTPPLSKPFGCFYWMQWNL